MAEPLEVGERLDPSPAEPVVLDTNALLDWLVFADRGAAALAGALAAGRLRWVASPSMLDELERVADAALCARWGREPAQVLALANRTVRRVEPAVPPPGVRLICADPDDQPFIDLALALGVRWLLTRDRALLRLAAPARRHGLRIAPPAHWPAAAAG